MRPERAYSPAARASDAPDPSRVLVIGCGALARELVAVIDQAGLANVDLTCLPATLHNRPGGIPAAVLAKVRAARPRYARIFVAYADCGTGGLLDLALANERVERLPGAHCYELYAGAADFAAMTDDDPATFFLTDFLARNFDRLVIVGLGLDRHPELLPVYFGNYHRLVYLAQTDDPALVANARRAARRLGLAFELRRTGYGDLATGLVAASATPSAVAAASPGATGSAASATPSAAARGASGVLAQDASIIGSAMPESPELIEIVHPIHGIDAQPGTRAERLRATYDSPVPRPAGRRFVHPMQREDGRLHRVQGSLRTTPRTRAATASPASPAGSGRV